MKNLKKDIEKLVEDIKTYNQPQFINALMYRYRLLEGKYELFKNKNVEDKNIEENLRYIRKTLTKNYKLCSDSKQQAI